MKISTTLGIAFLIPYLFWTPLCGDDNFTNIIRSAKEKVFPALVFVKPIQEYFGGGKREQAQVFGSGVVISPDGYVVTNHHVVQNARSIKCVLFDRQQMNASLIGLDSDTDVALLKLELPSGAPPLPFAEFGDSSRLQEGQFVMAMGSPFGFSRSISFGVVSYTRRYLDQGQYNLWIQTDAAINPGNSGGPLVDDAGRVIGINTLGTWAENISFAIPANTVQEVVAVLKKDGKVRRTWTGITFQALKDYSRETILDADRGVLVADVAPASPAVNAGLMSGDIILSCNGVPVNGVYLEDLPAVRSFFAGLAPDSTAAISILRNGQIGQLTMVLQSREQGTRGHFECARWNMTVTEIDKFDNPNMSYFRSKGVFVQGVSYPGNASRCGFERGDILAAVGEEEIDSLATARSVYEKSLAAEHKKVLCRVVRNGRTLYLALDYRRDYQKMEKER